MTLLLDLREGTLVEGAAEPDLQIGHDVDLSAEPPQLSGLSSVSVELPKFRDGRAFTQIRVLRERLGFTGEIRVTGHVIPDQAAMLARVGASTVVITQPSRAENFRAALKAYRYAYQRSAYGASAFDLRGGAS